MDKRVFRLKPPKGGRGSDSSLSKMGLFPPISPMDGGSGSLMEKLGWFPPKMPPEDGVSELLGGGIKHLVPPNRHRGGLIIYIQGEVHSTGVTIK